MKIGIETLLPTGNYLNKRYSIEMDFPISSDPMENFAYLNKLVKAIHKKEYPEFYSDDMPTYLGEDQLPIIQERDR